MLVLLTRLTTLLISIVLDVLVMTLMLILIVPLRKWLSSIGDLPDIRIVLWTQCVRLVLLQIILTVWLLSMQSGCIISGQLTLCVSVSVLLGACVAWPGGRCRFSWLTSRRKCLWLLVWLTVLGEALTTGVLPVVSVCVSPSGARLLHRMTMLCGPLPLMTLSMLLSASGLKHRWLEALQLAEMALGP